MTDNKPNNIILLSGANGYGKTSLLDAIEWCLTGTVKRIVNDYYKRCSTKTEQQIEDSDKGLIKNVNALSKETKVKITAIYKGVDVILYREFKIGREIEGLNNICIPTIECSNNGIKDELTKTLIETSNRFNDNFICSYDKNIELYTKGRKDIYDVFACIYGEFREANIIKNTLTSIKDKLSEEKDNLKSLLDSNTKEKEKLDSLFKEFKELSLDTKEEYPISKLFDEEVVTPYNLINIAGTEPQNVLNRQINLLHSIYQTKIKENIKLIHKKLSNQLNLGLLIQLEEEVRTKIDVIEKAKSIDFKIIEAEKQSLQQFSNKIDKSLKFENIDSFINQVVRERVINRHFNKETVEELIGYSNSIKDYLGKKSIYIEKLAMYDTSSPVMLVMRYIVDNVQALEEYRKDNDKCPVCGSLEFKQAKVGIIAKDFLGEKDIERQSITNEIKEIDENNNTLFNKLKKLMIDKINSGLKYYEDTLSLKDDLKVILQLCDKLNLKLDNIEKKNLLIHKVFYKQEIEKLNISDSFEQETVNNLEMLDLSFMFKYKTKVRDYFSLSIEERLKINSMLIQEFDRLSIIITANLVTDISNIDLKNIEIRLNICRSISEAIKRNKLYLQIVELDKREGEIKQQFDNTHNQIIKLNAIVSGLNKKIKDNEKKETERIAEPLDKIYRKITRNTNIKEIKLKRGNAQKSSELQIIDTNGKVIPFANVLSAGQLSTLSISIFLAKALLNDGRLKCYLMDEPIQTMDDLNILSFVDLIRFELNNKEEERFIDQLFISTCDSDLERLISHKMKGFKVPMCNYDFQGHGNYKKLI